MYIYIYVRVCVYVYIYTQDILVDHNNSPSWIDAILEWGRA